MAVPPTSFNTRSFRPVRGLQGMLSALQSRSHQWAGRPTWPILASLKGPNFHCTASTVTNANAPAVAEICARLDGLPLAIELAAARSRQFALPDLLRRLHQRLAVLVGSARDVNARHQTLRAAIEWSYDLLPPALQALPIVAR